MKFIVGKVAYKSSLENATLMVECRRDLKFKLKNYISFKLLISMFHPAQNKEYFKFVLKGHSYII